jgi:hypothetical protein
VFQIAFYDYNPQPVIDVRLPVRDWCALTFCLEISPMKDIPNSDAMDKVLECLLGQNGKMTESALIESTGLGWDQVDSALHRLLLRGLVRLDSYEHSKRGGQAGVRGWGSSSKTPLWEAVHDDEAED